MKLYVMRHGPAEARRGGMVDADRALTVEGRAETASVARGLARTGARPALILTSPLVRARQTAELVAQQLLDGEGVTLSDVLLPGAGLDPLVHQLRVATNDTLIVGHNPEMATFAGQCISPAATTHIDLSTAGVVCVAFEGAPALGEGTLRWYLRRAQLAALGELSQ